MSAYTKHWLHSCYPYRNQHSFIINYTAPGKESAQIAVLESLLFFFWVRLPIPA